MATVNEQVGQHNDTESSSSQLLSDIESSKVETCTEDSGIVEICDDTLQLSPEHHLEKEHESEELSETTQQPIPEPRPPSHPNEGKGSPKDVQRSLIRRINQMSTNGETSGGRDSPDSIIEDETRDNITTNTSQKSRNLLSLFKRKSLSYVSSTSNPSSISIVAASSTTGLILENRPRNLPSKSVAEERKHQKLYQEIVATARKKELRKAEEAIKKEERKKQKDMIIADAQKQWSEILPKWETDHNTKRVRELWWLGLPPGVRGTVWKKAIGNELNISHDLYKICLRRCTERLELAEQRDRSDSSLSVKSLSREGSVEVIHLDVQRTFPTLGFFQESGPYHTTLRDILGAYACYRPDVGYVQGMSFIAGVLLLNMEAADAFICLANLLNRPSYLAFFKVEQDLMSPFFETFSTFFKDHIPRLFAHFKELQFTPEFYLIEWIFTIYTRVLPLDVACRVWDLFCRDGDVFLYRTAIGILRMYQHHLLELTGIEEVGHFLGNIPNTINSDMLFQNIGSINIPEKKFKQFLTYYQKK